MGLEVILEEIDRLTPAEYQKLVASLDVRASSSEHFSDYFAIQELVCPYCGKSAVKNGTVRGKPRYKCKECKRSFGETSQTELYRSKKEVSVWLAYLRLFVQQQSLPSTVKELDINILTAYRWRMKILGRLKAAQDTHIQTYDHIVEVDETYLAESYKGMSLENVERDARTRGKEVHLRGISREQVAIVCMTDRQGNLTAFKAGKGRITANDITPVFDAVLTETAIICSDRARSYEKYAEHHQLKIQQGKGAASRRGMYNIQRVNAVHSQFKQFMRSFNGISSKNLDLYLAWFVWEQQIKHLTMEGKLKNLVSLLAPRGTPPSDRLDGTTHNMAKDVVAK